MIMQTKYFYRISVNISSKTNDKTVIVFSLIKMFLVSQFSALIKLLKQ